MRPRFAAELAGQPAAELKRKLRALQHFKQVQYFEMVEKAAGGDELLRRAARVKPVAGQLPKNQAPGQLHLAPP